VVKPSNGNAGKGIIIFRTQEADRTHWKDTVGKLWSLEEIKLHCADILEGIYSTYGQNPSIIVEERVPIHSKFLKYTYKGTPDIRIIVFNHVPVMAMLRLPTKESEGKANLHQGALGVGIDIFSGVTTHAITGNGKEIRFLPGGKKKLNGIKIPSWKNVLETAVQAADAAELLFCGVDLFVHEEKGPLVVELNANPGLSIQIANHAGLRRRLERVQDITVLNPEHGVRIGQALFAENFSDKIKAEDGLTIIKPYEEVVLYDGDKNKLVVESLINTGRFRSAISSNLASQLKLIQRDDLLWYQQEKEEGRVPVAEVTFKLKTRKQTTAMIVSKQLNKSKYQLEIGRNDLAGFLVGEVNE
ncbi:MAG TPA: sugar-transfer associated ATP-grasp domain-containing protein, partial [Flavobacterium sp.]|uniref:sugar-transfer associated ATP-grasp domain-containing protein n=1 Tax=Flavobacterium sp. TaxID=239 RepID=UPI002ED58AA6